jgi:hypothetical protein
MTVQIWLEWALADARRRKLEELEPQLEALGHAIRAIRDADFNHRADGRDDRRAEH